MQLSQKLKKSSQFFSPFPKCPSNFDHFEKKYENHSGCISEGKDYEKRGYLNI